MSGEDEARTATAAGAEMVPFLSGDFLATTAMLPGACSAVWLLQDSSILASGSSGDVGADEENVEAEEPAYVMKFVFAATARSPGGPGPMTQEVPTMTIVIPRPEPRARWRRCWRRVG